MSANQHKPGVTRELVYRFIEQFHEENGYAPSNREIAAGVGLSSTAVVSFHLRRLAKDGRVRWEEATPRSVRVVA